ncbi:eukaryotic translation initiation factor 3 subunit D isoform X1 [Ischnura elegans]|uniref:eukaryotic translation initiation factor 3 subunit D isoform X1 n=1 Tax=Ischnura elegans TaxID=197161 RepID=UPI001ED8957E|nr:eukaryotic translation initiation factor 3 subunit D isoform X1 [Ischnura elegans]
MTEEPAVPVEEIAHFKAPVIQDNVNGWGPCDVPDQFKDMPYQPFSKGDRLGKISDWTGAAFQDKKYANKYASQFGSGTQYAYYHDEDESTFHLVDTTRVQKPPYQRGRFRQMQRAMRGRQLPRHLNSQLQVLARGMKTRDKDRLRSQRKWVRHQGMRNMRNQPPIKNRDASVTVRSDWSTIEEMDFPRLAKLSLPNVKEAVDVTLCGSLEYYDKTYDRVNVKSEKPLQRIDRIFHTVTTTDDPIIRKLSKTEGNVYATDAILATIMCSTRSNYSWDIVIEKIGDKLFFDKRDNTEFDLLTVNETSVEPPQDESNSLNSPRSLALEATFINHNFSQQVLKMGEPRLKMDEPNPFISEDEEGEVASVAYRYRKWDLDNGVVLIARCEHDAVLQNVNGELQYITIKALNEWDSKLSGGVEWRQKLDTQRGAVLANELRNNACKLAKWTVQAILAGSDQIKFGYVSRAHVRDSSKHVILGTQQYKPHEFATQINLNMDNAWGILRCIVDICMKQKDGKYLIMKDPNKPMIRLYDIPDNTFDSENEDGDEDDSGDKATEAFQPLYPYSSVKRI